jgi:hypothetical protein
MSLDERIPVQSCMYGCHSGLDKYRVSEIRECVFEPRTTEKACDGCSRRGAHEPDNA